VTASQQDGSLAAAEPSLLGESEGESEGEREGGREGGRGKMEEKGIGGRNTRTSETCRRPIHMHTVTQYLCTVPSHSGGRPLEALVECSSQPVPPAHMYTLRA